MIYGMEVHEAYQFALGRFQTGDIGDSVQGFKVLCDIFIETHDRKYLDSIVEFYQLFRSDKDLPLTNSNIRRIATANNICEQYDSFIARMDHDNVLYVRSKLLGKTIEELAEEDRKEAERRRVEAETRRKQVEAWTAQGLCTSCGGTIKKGLFGSKCTKCGQKVSA